MCCVTIDVRHPFSLSRLGSVERHHMAWLTDARQHRTTIMGQEERLDISIHRAMIIIGPLYSFTIQGTIHTLYY